MATLAEQINAVYQLWGGRAANASELTVWTSAINSGATLDTVKSAILHDPLGRNYLPGAIGAVYQQWGGRAANASETNVWTNAIVNGGATFDTIRAAILNDPLGRNYLPGAINATYQLWGGRAANSAETGVWTSAIVNSGASFATIRSAILNDPLGRNYLPGAINALYQQWGGRAVNASETSVWTNAIVNGGAGFDTVKSAILNDPLGRNYLPGAINAMYQQWGGRAVNASETSVWTNAIVNGGATFDTIRSAILNDPLGRNYLPGAINAVYQLWGGRSANGAEAGVWTTAILNSGANFDTIKSAILNDPLGRGVINTIYQSLGGRSATAAELTSWVGPLSNGTATLQTVRNAVFAAGDLGQAFLPGQIALAMAGIGGRAPTGAESAQWMTWIGAGGSVAGLHDALVGDLGKPYWTSQLGTYFTAYGFGTPTTGEIDSLMGLLRGGAILADAEQAVSASHAGTNAYDGAIFAAFESYAGRAPNLGEYLSWRGSLTSVDTAPAVLKTGVVASSAGQAYLGSTITAIFQDAAGRAPTSTELTTCKAAVTNGSATFEAVRNGAIGTAADAGHVATAVSSLYGDYLGRAPTSAEQQDAATLVGTTHDIRAVGRAAFSSAEGIVHFFDTLHDLYPRLLGRDYSSADQQRWFNAIYNDGESLADVRAALMLDTASNAIRYSGTPANDTLVVQGLPADVVISQFDPVHDVIRLDASLAGTNLLDASHAREISIDGNVPEVLITYGANQALLLHGVHLAQLSAADFVFG